uniref:Uncharacterized protein n=1 Tax=Setaria italica TaxID=4555 RepID=K3XTF3_SETIT
MKHATLAHTTIPGDCGGRKMIGWMKFVMVTDVFCLYW